MGNIGFCAVINNAAPSNRSHRAEVRLRKGLVFPPDAHGTVREAAGSPDDSGGLGLLGGWGTAPRGCGRDWKWPGGIKAGVYRRLWSIEDIGSLINRGC